MWHDQTWFPTLLTELIDLPILLPSMEERHEKILFISMGKVATLV